jgi:hypothetical protein
VAINSVSTATGNEWQLISSVTPTNGASSVTFSSIAGYKTIMVSMTGIVSSATEALYLQFNGDTTAGDYFHTSPGVQLGRTVTSGAGGRMAIIYDVDKSAPHKVETQASANADATSAFNFWTTASPITSIACVFVTSATFTAAGTIALYGIAA